MVGFVALIAMAIPAWHCGSGTDEGTGTGGSGIAGGTCSNGANGPCAAQFNAVARSSDAAR